MNQFVVMPSPALGLYSPAGASVRTRDFFSSHIRNANTRRAYIEAVRQFSAFCAEHGIVNLAQVEQVRVAAFVETPLKNHSPTGKLRIAALRMLIDWMVVGQIIPLNRWSFGRVANSLTASPRDR